MDALDPAEHPVSATMLDLQVRVAELGLLDIPSLDPEGTRAALAEIDDIKEIVALLQLYLS